ncbi:hypothetical protein AAFF_G00150690 [Aldrovandia affinis]|uniref:Uncharacterized protein n=1 Tax=Aldrovandia affinis TaxID=143900 RepID=A0AAD7RPG5_9TELE|nr:hypothetical protein AAFF_G00150690 [Aldrovandia affinis]
MSHEERRHSLTVNQRRAYEANRRAQASYDRDVKTIEAARIAVLERHDRQADAHVSKLAQYRVSHTNPCKRREKESHEDEDEPHQRKMDVPPDRPSPHRDLKERRRSTMF